MDSGWREGRCKGWFLVSFCWKEFGCRNLWRWCRRDVAGGVAVDGGCYGGLVMAELWRRRCVGLSCSVVAELWWRARVV